MNLFQLPYREDLDKSAGSGPDPYAAVLVSGDPEKFASILSDEDRAFLALSPGTVQKLASQQKLSEQDVNQLSDEEIAALGVLGFGEAETKVAAYVEFIDQIASYEMAGRGLARQLYHAEKLAAQKAEKEAETSKQSPAYKAELAKRAGEELARRQKERLKQAQK